MEIAESSELTKGVERGTVRFGTLTVDLSLAHPRYRVAMDTHLRTVIDEVTRQAALVMEVVDLDEEVPLAKGRTLTVTRTSAHTTWGTEVGWARLDPRSREALIALHPIGQREGDVLHAFALLVRKILQGMGIVRLHAGGVVVGERVAVFVGEKGAGKSTLALGLGRRGAIVLGDDQLTVERREGGVAVAGSDARIRLTAETEAYFFAEPLPLTPAVLAGVAKKEARLADLVTADLYAGHRPTDLWFPEVGHRYDLAPMGGREALQHLLSALNPLYRFADAQDRREFVDLVAPLVETTDARRLTLSPDLDELERVWEELHR